MHGNLKTRKRGRLKIHELGILRMGIRYAASTIRLLGKMQVYSKRVEWVLASGVKERMLKNECLRTDAYRKIAATLPLSKFLPVSSYG